jgi:hypothetical protein
LSDRLTFDQDGDDDFMETPQFNQVSIPQTYSWDHVFSSNWLGGQEADEEEEEEEDKKKKKKKKKNQNKTAPAEVPFSSYFFVFSVS